MSNSRNKTFLFYDIETSGLSKCFDQVMQFAAIRTDLELNELERHNIFVKLNQDTIPSPEAILTHQISLKKLHAEGISDNAAINLIHKLLNTSGTISLGYNTLGFDDEFLRFSFYKNLLPPYTHQYANGCSRMDIYPIAAMYYLFKPETLNWPKINNVISLKLENLSKENNFPNLNAHDALVDVENTLNLAKNFSKEKEIWNYTLGYFNKNIELERINKLNSEAISSSSLHKIALLVDGSFGAKNNFQSIALNLGNHNHYKNQTLWLFLDSQFLATTTNETIAKTTFALHKKPGEEYFTLPTTERFMKNINPERISVVQKNLAWLKENPKLFQEIIHYHKEYTYPKIPNLDIDAALYQNGFLSSQEGIAAAKFNNAPFHEKLEAFDILPNNLREQAMRIFGRNYFEHLSANLRNEFQEYLEKINPVNPLDAPVDYRGERRLTPKEAVKKCEILKASGNLNCVQCELLDELENYLQNTF
jgi:exodeoxyribonuclease I